MTSRQGNVFRVFVAAGVTALLGSLGSLALLGEPALALRGVVLWAFVGLSLGLAEVRSRGTGGPPRPPGLGLTAAVAALCGLAAAAVISALPLLGADPEARVVLHVNGPLFRGWRLCLLTVAYCLAASLTVRLRYRTGCRGWRVLPWVGFALALCDLGRFLPILVRNPVMLLLLGPSATTTLGPAIGVTVAGMVFPPPEPDPAPPQQPGVGRRLAFSLVQVVYGILAVGGWYPLGLLRLGYVDDWRRACWHDESLLAKDSDAILRPVWTQARNGVSLKVVRAGGTVTTVRRSLPQGTDAAVMNCEVRKTTLALAVRCRTSDGETHRVWVEEIPGTARLFEREFPGFNALALSPDGESLAVAAGEQLAVIAWRDGTTTAAIALPAAVADVTWHPSGRQIVCSRETGRGADTSLLCADLDAGTCAKLAAGGTHPRFPADGSCLYVVHDQKLHTLPWPPDGTPPRQVLDITPVRAFSLSPDGTRVCILAGMSNPLLEIGCYPIVADLPPGRRRYAAAGREVSTTYPHWCAWLTDAPGQRLANAEGTPP
ncbi:MAG: hypothetical protein BWZ02_02650 [Lentisphaerae bacterium ADurb.BinA184]|nr:MAG: hypothetical protein BWZ02_02650 [Lentisphaerae bacterium ADurb.BinA184]